MVVPPAQVKANRIKRTAIVAAPSISLDGKKPTYTHNNDHVQFFVEKSRVFEIPAEGTR